MDTLIPFHRPSSGELFRELLKNDETQGHVTAAPARDRETRFEDSNTEGRTVELLVGDHITMQELNDLRTLQVRGIQNDYCLKINK